jgi:ribosomal protein S27E
MPRNQTLGYGHSAFSGVNCTKCGGHASTIQWWKPYCIVCLNKIANKNGGKCPMTEPEANGAAAEQEAPDA